MNAPTLQPDKQTTSMAQGLDLLAPYSAYGWRAKIGVIVPPTNTVNEAEWHRLLPDGVTMHVMRMALHPDSASAEGRKRLLADIDAALALLTPARPDVIAYACTAGSMTNPPTLLTDHMTAVTGGPSVTTAKAIIDALRALSVKNIALATPYDEKLNEHEIEFLGANGVTVTASAGLGLGANGPAEYRHIARLPPELVYRHARAVVTPKAEALVISCTDFSTLPVIERLEADLGLPVVTSNTATLWACLRAAGVTVPALGGGMLLTQRN